MIEQLYQQVVRGATFGGALLGLILGLCHAAAVYRKRGCGALSEPRRAHYRDGQLILLLALIPQSLILTLPILYPRNPGEVPRDLAEGTIMCGAALATFWIWSIYHFIRAGAHGRAFHRSALLGLTSPLLLVVMLFLIFLLRGGRP